MSIAENVARILADIERAAIAAGRDPKEITLCAATKMNDADRVRQAIAKTIDCQSIINDSYGGAGMESDTIYYPGFLGSEVKGDAYEQDQIGAAALLTECGFTDKDENGYLEDKNGKEIYENESVIDFTNHGLSKYLIKLSPLVSAGDERVIGSYFHVLNDVERIGDHAENFHEIGVQMENENLRFSDAALEEIKKMQGKISHMFEIASEAFESVNGTHLSQLTALENEVDEMKRELSANHFERLADGKCQVELSAYFFSTIAGLERVADHLINVGYSVLNPTGSQSEARKEALV